MEVTLREHAPDHSRSIHTRENRLFAACILSLVASSFGFVVRAMLLNTLGVALDLTESQKGALQGAGLFPFALSIIVFSLIIDHIGYGRALAFAWALHVLSAIITITAGGYIGLYIGTFLFSLANGIVEAVVNPVTTTLFSKSKTPRLIMLHSGWAAGLVLGGLLTIALSNFGWRWKIGLFLLPTLVYGLMMRGQKFPASERVVAEVSYTDMMKEFGWAGSLIVCIFASYAINEVAVVFGSAILPAHHSLWAAVAYALAPTLYFAFRFRSAGRPMFIFLLLVMMLLATTELGTESWISDLLTPVLKGFGSNAGSWVLIYTSVIVFGLRFFAGPLAHQFSPVGLLIGCSLMAAAGLFWLAHAGTGPLPILLSATLYGAATGFFWPTTLGLVSEQFPRGGALTLNSIGAMGMISVGILGGPFLGTLQDASLDRNLQRASPALHAAVAEPAQQKFGFDFHPLDKTRIGSLSVVDKARVEKIIAQTSQAVLAKIAILPSILFVCFLGLAIVFRQRGGYRPVELGHARQPVVASRSASWLGSHE
jgi:MFS family permease